MLRETKAHRPENESAYPPQHMEFRDKAIEAFEAVMEAKKLIVDFDDIARQFGERLRIVIDPLQLFPMKKDKGRRSIVSSGHAANVAVIARQKQSRVIPVDAA